MIQNEDLEQLVNVSTSFFDRHPETQPQVYISIDGFMITSIGNQIDIYNDLVTVFKDYFSSQHINVKFIPPLGGRGATTGGGILTFLLTHGEFLVAIIRSLPVVYKFAKYLKTLYEKKQATRLQIKYNKYKPFIPVSIHIVNSSMSTYEGSTVNRKSISNLLLHINELHKMVTKSFPTFRISYNLKSEIQNSSTNLFLDLYTDRLDSKFIAKIFKTIDSKYIDDDTRIHFSFSSNNGKFKKIIRTNGLN